MGVDHGIIDKSGAWYSYNGERIGQGKENSRAWLKEHPMVADEIETGLREKLMPHVINAELQSEDLSETETTEA